MANPRILLDISNDVAITNNVKPQRRKIVSGKSAPTRSAPTAEAHESLRSDAEHDAISAKLSDALPRGKKFDRDRIRKKEAAVSDRMITILPSREEPIDE